MYSNKKPDYTRISLGDFRIVNGKLEEKVLHIQHRKIKEVEPFCREIWQEIKFSINDLVFEPSPGGVMCILSYKNCRKILYKYGTYFIDGRGLVCVKISVLLVSGECFTDTIFVLSHGCRVRAK
jgi:hypothetical protein